jgi:hypothetical protein
LESGQVPNPVQHKNKELSDFPYFHFFKNLWRGEKILSNLGKQVTKKTRAISTIQLTIAEGTLIETKEETIELMVNETSLTLWKVVVNAYNYNNLLNKWECAI